MSLNFPLGFRWVDVNETETNGLSQGDQLGKLISPFIHREEKNGHKSMNELGKFPDPTLVAQQSNQRVLIKRLYPS